VTRRATFVLPEDPDWRHSHKQMRKILDLLRSIPSDAPWDQTGPMNAKTHIAEHSIVLRGAQPVSGTAAHMSRISIYSADGPTIHITHPGIVLPDFDVWDPQTTLSSFVDQIDIVPLRLLEMLAGASRDDPCATLQMMVAASVSHDPLLSPRFDRAIDDLTHWPILRWLRGAAIIEFRGLVATALDESGSEQPIVPDLLARLPPLLRFSRTLTTEGLSISFRNAVPASRPLGPLDDMAMLAMLAQFSDAITNDHA